jgi:hypothetical protein
MARDNDGGLIEFIPIAGPLALVLLPALLLGWLGPKAISSISGSRYAVAKKQTLAARALQEESIATKGPPQTRVYLSKLKLEYPASVRVSETINLRAWLQPDSDYQSPLAGKLETQDFKITATNASDAASTEFKYEWDWLLSPNQSGDKALYFWVDPSTQLILVGDPGTATVAPAKNKVYLPIVVTTDLGLTTRQDAWAKAIGALLGLIATISGYSFWKWMKRKETTRRDSDD